MLVVVGHGAVVGERIDVPVRPVGQHTDNRIAIVPPPIVEFALRIDDVQRAKEARALMKAKAVNGLSIGFMSKQWSYDRDSEVRTLTEVDLWEVSLVTFPANRASRITGVKAAAEDITTPKDAERILRDAGISKAEALAFVSRVMRLGEERRDSAQSTAHALQAARRLLDSLNT